ncbi:MAG: hypothetical protein ACLGI7_03155 [Gammaproteobacteria bacterium]
MQLRRSGTPGFDLSGATTNGRVSIDVDGTEAVGTQSETSAHRRTPDYDSRAVQIAVEASTTNGNVSIRD